MTAEDRPSAYVGALLSQRWRLQRPLGEGGVGLVFEAEDSLGGPARAVKLLRHELCGDAEVVTRFLAEAQSASVVAHPGITQVLGVERAEDGTPYLVMELLHGRPLSATMNQGRMPVDRAVALAHELLDTLGAAHRAGVVHRDLKPDNVFVEESSDGSHTKLLDFGLARVIEAAGGATRRTRTGMLLGTPGYMSPEQIRSAKDADHRSDLWSVAVLLFEMLTGRRAYEADNEFARLTAVLVGPPPDIAEVAPHFTHFQEFFRRALAPDANQRFQSAEEMSEALSAVAHGSVMPPPSRMLDVAVAPTALAPTALAPPEIPSAVPPASRAGPFGGVDTALSPAGLHGPPVSSPPVAVVRPSWRPRGVPIATVVAISVAAFLVGFVVAWLLFR
jgi:serine/threonine protein kinase